MENLEILWDLNTPYTPFHGLSNGCARAHSPEHFSWRIGMPACSLPSPFLLMEEGWQACSPAYHFHAHHHDATTNLESLARLITGTSKQVITFWVVTRAANWSFCSSLYSFTFVFLPCGVCWPSDCISANNIMHSTAWSTNWRRNSAAHAVTFSPFVQTWGKRYKYNNDAGKQLIWVWTLKSEPAWSSEKLVANGLSGLLITWMAAKFKTKRVFSSWKFLNLATVAPSFLFDS